MTREELAEMDRQNADCDLLLRRMGERRIASGDDDDIRRTNWMPSHRSRREQGTTVDKRVVEQMVREMQSPQHSQGYVEGWTRFVDQCIDRRDLLDKDFHDKFVDWYTNMLAEEVGRIERGIRNDLVQRQDTEIAALRAEVTVLRAQVSELVDITQGLAADIAELQADMGDAMDRSGNVTKLRKRNAAA
ncbi:hypothetical protein [Bradyrhizobium liaoningense]|uniref:hypothetical protein n=1 Tax=Bradyrhizobium liaoningense TaxID=43992 RepID=UPI001BAE0EBD|nr:hypothetical protein [Bradyrhizobium liaoningense]MBR0714051.1 hypothetical protein [Bradyrhizobium liaoningense]